MFCQCVDYANFINICLIFLLHCTLNNKVAKFILGVVSNKIMLHLINSLKIECILIRYLQCFISQLLENIYCIKSIFL